jgi:uncharacterized membrane protein
MALNFQLPSFFKKPAFLLAIIVALGAGLRLINIGGEPYWSDELLSLSIAKHYLGDIAGLWHYLQIAEVHPPLYYYLMQIWGSWFGFAEAGIRSLSLIFSLGIIGLAYWAGLVLFDSKKIGLLAAFFTAILPMQIEFGQEARPYAIYCFFGILSLILLFKYFTEQKTAKKLWLISLFIVCNVIGLYLHYSYALILIPLSSYWLIRLIIKKSSREFLWWLSTMAIIFVGFLPWLPTLIFKTFLINNIVTEIGRGAYFVRPFAFFENAFNGLLWADKQSPHIMEIIVALLVKIMFAGLLVMIIKNKDLWLKKYKNSLIYLVAILILSILLFLCMPSSANYTALLFKHILFDSIILALLMGALFRQIENGHRRLICLLLLMVSLMTFQIKIISNDSIYDIDYRFKMIVDHINENYQEGDMLLIYLAQIRPQANYYLKDEIPGFVGVFPADIMLPDFMAARDTLGFMENESQLRFSMVSWPSMGKKLNYLIKKNQPRRVWVFGDGVKDQIREWLVLNGWKIGFEPIGSMFPLALYIK